MLCLQEKKLDVVPNAKCYNLWGHNVGWIHKESKNKVGEF